MIRKVRKEDYQQIKELIVIAFTESEYGYTGEDELVEKIRLEDNYLEVVCVENEKIVGHGLLSSSWIESDLGEVVSCGLVLAPLAILPDYQGRGIGEKIIVELESDVKDEMSFISILGDPSYYGRFGYISAENYGIRPPFEVSNEYFMIKEIKDNGLLDSQGTLKYNRAFDE